MNDCFLTLDVAANNLFSQSSMAINHEFPDIFEPPYPPHDFYGAQHPRLQEHHYQRIESIGDGNCVFRSVSYLLYGTQEYYQYVREVAVDHMFRNLPRYFPGWADEEMRSHLHLMSQTSPPDDPRIWADEGVIHAIASVFRLKIVRLSDSGCVISYTLPDDGIYKQKIHLCFTNKHADSMLPIDVTPPKSRGNISASRDASIRLSGYFCQNDLDMLPISNTMEM